MKSRSDPRTEDIPSSFKVNESEAQWKKMFSLIKKEKWDRIGRLLDGPDARSFCTGCDSTGLSVASMAICSYAPLMIIDRILEVNPSCTMEADNFGAIALHLACLNGAPADIIKLIIAHDKGVSVTMRDDDLRVPLHHAVEFAARLDLRESDSSMPSSSLYSSSKSSVYSSPSSFHEDLEVIQGLCDVAPETVHFTNKNNDTPMDILHVIRGMVETEEQHLRIESVYAIMKEASIRVYKRNRLAWESQKYCPTDFVGKVDDRQPSVVSSTVTSSTASFAPHTKTDPGDSNLAEPMDFDGQKSKPSSLNKQLNKEKMSLFGFHFKRDDTP